MLVLVLKRCSSEDKYIHAHLWREEISTPRQERMIKPKSLLAQFRQLKQGQKEAVEDKNLQLLQQTLHNLSRTEMHILLKPDLE